MTDAIADHLREHSRGAYERPLSIGVPLVEVSADTTAAVFDGGAVINEPPCPLQPEREQERRHRAAVRVELVRDLPDPPELTAEDIDRLRAESREWWRAFEERTEGMEVSR